MSRKLKLRKEYKFSWQLGQPTHVWSIAGEKGAIHLHIRKGFSGVMEYIGGLEVHYRKAPEYMRGDAPSHDHCPFLGGAPCWHDGSSLEASERWIPRWLSDPHNHEGMLNSLENRYLQAFENDEE